MKIYFQILLLLLTCFVNLANITPAFTKTVLPTFIFQKTNNVKEVASKSLRNWTDKYTGGGDEAWHQAGKDAVAVFSIGKTTAAIAISIKSGLEKKVDDAVEEVVAKEMGKVAKLGEKLNVSDYATSVKNSIKDAMTPDHIPSFAALKKNLENKLGRDLDPTELTQLRNEGTSLLYETSLHQQFSRTYGGRNTVVQIADDAQDLYNAAQKDMDALRTPLKNSGMSDADIEKAFELIHEMNRKKGLY